MWFDPLPEMKTYMFYPDQEQFLRQHAWLLMQYDTTPAEPISLRNWLVLIGESLLAFTSLFKRSSVSQAIQPDCPTLHEILTYPLHVSKEDDTHFSLN